MKNTKYELQGTHEDGSMITITVKEEDVTRTQELMRQSGYVAFKLQELRELTRITQ